MKTDLNALAADVDAAIQEFDLAVRFHELWKPTAYDKALRERMGVSYATQAFHVVRVALRRETLLALMRLWDKPRKAVRLDQITASLAGDVVDAIVAKALAHIKIPEAEDQIREDVLASIAQATELADRYARNGQHLAVLKKLTTFRHERLAHRQVVPGNAEEPDATDEEIETFFQDTSKLVALLLHIVKATAYDPSETAEVYGFYAKFFWAAVRGERTDGHPSYRAAIPV